MKKKLTIALIIIASAFFLVAFSPSAAGAVCNPNSYVEPAVCNETNPPGELDLGGNLATTGSEFDWSLWMVGGILLLGSGIVALNVAAKKRDKDDEK